MLVSLDAKRQGTHISVLCFNELNKSFIKIIKKKNNFLKTNLPNYALKNQPNGLNISIRWADFSEQRFEYFNFTELFTMGKIPTLIIIIII
jgi:hypothetical protein